MRLVPRWLIAVASAVALSAGLLSVATGPPAEAASHAKTSKVEKRRSKAVKTPVPTIPIPNETSATSHLV